MTVFKKTTLFLAGIILISLISVHSIFIHQWQPVLIGKLFGISGIALIENNNNSFSFLIAHDNKREKEARLGILIVEKGNRIKYTALKWPEGVDLPIDLEALTLVPGSDKSFFALASNGKLYYIKVDVSGERISVLYVLTLPNVSGRDNYEGFSLQEIDGELLVVWAKRGENNEPGLFSWGIFDLGRYQFRDIKSSFFKSSWPRHPDVRHISDLKVDLRGNLFISSVSDRGDMGPFQSAVYMIGSFKKSGNEIIFQKRKDLKRIYRINGHKIEGLEILGENHDNMILGSDDENFGSSFAFLRIKPAL